MTDLRKAAEMALEALWIWEKMQPNTSASAVRVPAIQALRQALAQPVDLTKVGDVVVWGKWVGLTEDDFYGQSESQVMAMKYAETKLKEKNT